ncbi:uncharacterized protein THITE_2092797 [Thermothielavioides terrestris NRRL 8126]|uniref:Uncharacterized protein n=1 Tax=Thermothielavioides terrestris (strain ATCC 38088 / NRRL 8126) TaxID=578455 RepID=G2RHH6_THETT|nr:uncharacterized protein THITE_2092797 [Thermothielavioides terrestris NRRL 8126]AEO71288.1 hypothetical protein THITE_2092797 [Thermothielavioides terrestris NRRL 8126]
MEPPPPSPPPPPAALSPAPISEPLLRAVYASDQTMYPAALPYARLRAWVDAAPDLSISFVSKSRDDAAAADTADTAAVGVVIALPLRRTYWLALLDGRLKESEIDPGRMFPCARGEGCGEDEEQVKEEEVEVGLHVYHIERFGAGQGPVEPGLAGVGAEGRRFSEVALEEVVRRARGRRPGWKVVGLSALTATTAGRRTFQRLGFTPTGYKELFVMKPGEDASGGDAADAGGNLLEMVCQYPGDRREPGEVTGGRVMTGVSEMNVKYIMSQGN